MKTTTAGFLASCLVLMVTLTASPARAQASGADNTSSRVAVEVDELHFVESGSIGFDANYSTKQFTQPATGLGLRVGVVGEGGYHHFKNSSFTLFQGGAHVTTDRLSSAKIQPYGNFMIGLGHRSSDFGFSGNDTIFSEMAGADFPLAGKSYAIRGEIGQVWDFASGGHSVAWRYAVGLSLPLK